MRNIETITDQINEYIKISIYMLNVKEDKQIMTGIDRKIHFVNDLKTNLLIENDFLKFEKVIIDVNKRKIIIVNCNVTIDFFIKQRDLYVKRNIYVNQIIIILTNQEILISIKFSISENKDFLFELFSNVNVTLFHYVIDFYTNEMIIRNDSFKFLKILNNFRFEIIIEMIYDDYLLIT